MCRLLSISISLSDHILIRALLSFSVTSVAVVSASYSYHFASYHAIDTNPTPSFVRSSAHIMLLELFALVIFLITICKIVQHDSNRRRSNLVVTESFYHEEKEEEIPKVSRFICGAEANSKRENKPAEVL